MELSVIIPAYNEEEFIADTVKAVFERAESRVPEILVVDGGSSDETVRRARGAGATAVVSPRQGRAAQMNFGAEQSEGDLLYFLHADSIPPPGYDAKLNRAIEAGRRAGCFQLAFDDDHWLLRAYAWFTRFDVDAFRFGDQSLFIERELFEDMGGFREDHLLMEDNEMVRRIKRRASFAILDDAVTTSARSYRKVGVVRLQLVFVLIYTLYFLGVEQRTLANIKKEALS